MFAGNINIVLRLYVIFSGFYLYKLLFAYLPIDLLPIMISQSAPQLT